MGFANKLPEAVEFANEKLEIKIWSYGVDRYYLRNISERFFVGFELNRLAFTSIGLNAWTKNCDDLAAVFRSCLGILGIKQVKGIAFRPLLFLPMDMTHSEIVDLLFGSFLIRSRQLDNICGPTDDALVQLHGKIKGMKIRVLVAPNTTEQVAANFSAQPFLDLLIEPKNYDNGLKEARDRFSQDCLHLDIDVSREVIAADEVTAFMRESLSIADSVAENSIALLKSVKSKGANQNGSAK